MTDLRTAAQQALIALSCIEYSICGITDGPSDDTTEAAIESLKAALAEPNRAQKMTEAGYTRRPTLREMAESEPCQYPDCVDNGPDVECTRWLLDECLREDYKPKRPAEPLPPIGKASTDVGVPVYVVKKAEPVQPVAWQDTAKPTELVCAEHWEDIDPIWHWMYRPLYTAPPQRKPLSATDALRIATEAVGRLQSVGPVQGLVGLVRAVEAAHGIKEGI